MSTQTPPEKSIDSVSSKKIRIGSLISLLLALVFFSGTMGGKDWLGWKGWGIFDFTTLNGAFGTVVNNVKVTHTETITAPAKAASTEAAPTAEAAPAAELGHAVDTGRTTYKGTGGRGAMDGFLFAFGLIPTVMFALAMINVFEHYGALDAAKKLLTPILKPILGIPGSAALAFIGSLQSTDVGASLTRQLSDDKAMTENQRDTFLMFQFSAGAMITNFFGSGAVLFTLLLADGTAAVPTTIGLCLVVIFAMKIVGANLFRIIVGRSAK